MIEATAAIETTDSEVTSLADPEVDTQVATGSSEVMAGTTTIGTVDLQVDGVEAKAATSGPIATETTMMMTAMATRGKAGAATPTAIRGETTAAKATTGDTPAASASAQTSDRRQRPKQPAAPGPTCR